MRLGVSAQSIQAIVWDTLDPNRGLSLLFQTAEVWSSKVGMTLCLVEKATNSVGSLPGWGLSGRGAGVG